MILTKGSGNSLRFFASAVIGLAFSPFVFTGSTHAAEASTVVTSGSVIIVDGKSHRLYGIRAPKPGDTCQLRGKQRDCGILSRAGLMDLTAGARVVCNAAPGGLAGSRCLSDGYDLTEGMIHTGWAQVLSDAPPRLHTLMKTAKAKKRGLWHD